MSTPDKQPVAVNPLTTYTDSPNGHAPGASIEATPRLPLTFIAINRSRFGLPIRIVHRLPQDVPQSFLDRYGERVKAAENHVEDTWKVNTRISVGKGLLTGRDIVKVNARPATYASWHETGKSDMNPALRDIVRHAGTSINLLTSDNMIMFQFRSKLNRSYKEWFGSGASGSVEAKVTNAPNGRVDWSQRGVRLANVTSAIFKHTALRELKEETGHSLRVLGPSQLKLLGVFQTTQKPVDEFAFLAKTAKTSEEITRRQDVAIAKNGDTVINPMDRIGFIEASSDAVEKLLTQVQSPFNPTGLGAMLLTGRYLAFKESLSKQQGFGKRRRATEDAEAWLERVSYDTAVHYAKLGHIAGEYNRKFNETLPQGATKRLEGIDPWAKPEEQDLLSMEEGLQKAGLYYRRDGKTVGERQYTSPTRRAALRS